jgi:putative ABC transport system ATP-binding protein
LILADEPTASLDTEHAYDVVNLLIKEAHEKQKATIMVTHDERMIQHSDRIFHMQDGQLVEQPFQQ